MISIKSVLTYTVLLFSLIFLFILYIIGVAHYITDHEENTCEMTYMFEYPQYVRIALDDDIEDKYPRYGLYAYGEGFVTEKLRRMHFTGIPILFIPGNAGSHEQVRSLASVSLRKSLKDRSPFHFDYFTVSLGNDYPALYGGVLMEETTYVSHCIRKILSLYKGNIDSVVLIGHSMGGIIAKGALLLVPNTNASYANIIINLATPHTPSLVLDSTFAGYYRELENRMPRIKEAGTNVISISGGPRDILVTAAQTMDPAADINAISTSIPDVWRSTDHLSILWCKQLVLSIVRSLFDSIDYYQRPYKISSRSEYRMKALSYHLLQRSSGKRLYNYKETMQFELDSEWIEINETPFTWYKKHLGSKKTVPVFIMIKRTDKLFNYLTIQAINMEAKDWLFTCIPSKNQGTQKICEWGWNLTNQTRMSPDYLHRLRKTVDLNLQEVQYPSATHVVVRIPPDELHKNVILNFDTYSIEERVTTVNTGISLLKYIFSFNKPNLMKPISRNLRYYVNLIDIMDVASIQIYTVKCTDIKESTPTIVELLEPWNPGAIQVRFFTELDSGPKTIKMQTTYGKSNVTPVLRLTLDQACSYMLQIKQGGLIDQISCSVRDRWPLLYIIIMSLIIIAISIRVDHGLEKTPTITVTIILSFYFGVAYESCIAFAILCTCAIGICCSIIFLGSVAHGLAVRFLARAIAFSTTWSDWLLGGLNKLPIITTTLLLSLIPSTCGALAMLVSVFLYFLLLTRMYEDYLEELLMSSLDRYKWIRRLKPKDSQGEEKDTRWKIFNHLAFFLLWCFASIPAIPSVLVWAKNFSYDMKLSTEDPILLKCWMILVTCGTMELVQISPNYLGNRSRILANVLRMIGWIGLSMAAAPNPSFYQWYMPPFAATAVSLIAVNFLIPGGLYS